jgi:hypothetical protein
VSKGEKSKCCLFVGVLLIIYLRVPCDIAGLQDHLIGLGELIRQLASVEK